MPRKRKEDRTIKDLKKNCWRLFSKYIRLKDADENGYVKCVTCDKIDHWTRMHAGHYIHKKTATYFDERNVGVQDIRCNHFLSGNLAKYHEYMLKTYGQDVIDYLVREGNKVCRLDILFYQTLEKEIKEKLKELDI
jgi:hypothetical protein